VVVQAYLDSGREQKYSNISSILRSGLESVLMNMVLDAGHQFDD
jgi:hypothetical protein